MLGTIKILSGTQGRWLLRGENKLTLMLIRRLGPTVANFYPMIIIQPMMRIWCNTKLQLDESMDDMEGQFDADISMASDLGSNLEGTF